MPPKRSKKAKSNSYRKATLADLRISPKETTASKAIYTSAGVVLGVTTATSVSIKAFGISLEQLGVDIGQSSRRVARGWREAAAGIDELRRGTDRTQEISSALTKISDEEGVIFQVAHNKIMYYKPGSQRLSQVNIGENAIPQEICDAVNINTSQVMTDIVNGTITGRFNNLNEMTEAEFDNVIRRVYVRKLAIKQIDGDLLFRVDQGNRTDMVKLGNRLRQIDKKLRTDGVIGSAYRQRKLELLANNEHDLHGLLSGIEESHENAESIASVTTHVKNLLQEHEVLEGLSKTEHILFLTGGRI